MMETQIDSGVRHQGVERVVAGKAENVDAGAGAWSHA
jgi:hypothetical protein